MREPDSSIPVLFIAGEQRSGVTPADWADEAATHFANGLVRPRTARRACVRRPDRTRHLPRRASFRFFDTGDARAPRYVLFRADVAPRFRSRTLSKHSGLLRSRDSHARVTFVELFFDLVFVFAVTQLSHTLLEHLTLVGALQTLFLLLAVWWVWMYTCWFTNWIDPDKPAVRMLMFALMLAGLLMSASIPHAFDHEGLLFAIAYAFIQVVRTLFMLCATRGHDPVNYRNFQRILVLAAGVGACSGSRAASPSGTERVVAWVIALASRSSGRASAIYVPGLGRSTTTDWKVDGAHMAERCALFVIIALGESILVTGATAACAAGDRRRASAPSWSRSSAAWRCGGSTSTSAPSAAAARSRGSDGSGARGARRVHLFPHSRSSPASSCARWRTRSPSRIRTGTWSRADACAC